MSSPKKAVKSVPKTIRPDATNKIGFFHMIRDVLVASINKGQFLVALVGAIVFLFIWRIPAQDLTLLAREIGAGLQEWSVIGWLLFALVSLSWCVFAIRSRRIYRAEIRRVSAEKSDLQKKLLGTDAPSSRE